MVGAYLSWLVRLAEFRLTVTMSTLDLSAPAVSVASVLDAEDHDLMGFLVDSVQDAVGASPSGTNPSEVVSKHLADALGVLDQRSGHKFDDGGCDGLWKLALKRS